MKKERIRGREERLKLERSRGGRAGGLRSMEKIEITDNFKREEENK